jgi:N-acetylglucosamine-6-phosphate deacetylase
MSATVFSGAAVFDGARLHPGAALVVEDGRVAGIVPEAEAQGARVALGGGVLAPGFVDLQVNGGGGVLLNDRPDVEGLRAICEAHGRLGTTALLPTLVTDTPAVTRATIAAGVAAAEAALPGFLGLHLEGPHLAVRRKGAHDPALIRPMTDDDLAVLCDAAERLPALIVTVAPESVTPEQVAALAAAGVIVSLGHTDTGAEAARAAFAAGARMVTHLFNAMSQLGNREPGLVGAALDSEEVAAGLIADGIHVAPASMRVALAAKRGTDTLFLVTDAMPVAGTELAWFELNGRRIVRRDGRLMLEDGTLAGADIDFPGSIRVLVREGVPLERALRMATAAPAAAIGARDRCGSLAPGMPADLVHLDADLALRGVWRAGRPL